jgi:hypothetical protein
MSKKHGISEKNGNCEFEINRTEMPPGRETGFMKVK